MQLSIVIPHLNNVKALERCLSRLNQQSLDRALYEIIVVDNGSNQLIPPSCTGLADKVLTYIETQDPYNCRNYGIKQSQGDNILLLDTTVLLRPETLQGLLLSMKEADVVVPTITIGPITSKYERFYAYRYLNSSTKNSFVTAALCVRRTVFDQIGFFVENTRSGADIEWAQRVYKSGIRIKVKTPLHVDARPKKKQGVLASAHRDGRGAFLTYKASGKSIFFHLKMIAYHVLPDSPARIKARIKSHEDPKQFYPHRWSLFWITWRVNLYFLSGYLRAILLR